MGMEESKRTHVCQECGTGNVRRRHEEKHVKSDTCLEGKRFYPKLLSDQTGRSGIHILEIIKNAVTTPGPMSPTPRSEDEQDTGILIRKNQAARKPGPMSPTPRSEDEQDTELAARKSRPMSPTPRSEDEQDIEFIIARLNESYKSLGISPGEKEKMEALVMEISLKKKKPYYDTNGKRGLLVTILNWDFSDLEEGHKKDKGKLESFFHGTLNFEMMEMENDRKFSRAGTKQFLQEVKEKLRENPKIFYCVVFCISSHGDEKGINFDDDYMTIGEIRSEFGNGSFDVFAGRPKIFLVDACRGEMEEGSPPQQKGLSKSSRTAMTNDSDSLIMYATTEGKTSWQFDSGSLGLQKCIETFQEEWKYNDLHDMLITTQEKVAKGNRGCKQTAEVTSTLLKRFRFQPAITGACS